MYNRTMMPRKILAITYVVLSLATIAVLSWTTISLHSKQTSLQEQIDTLNGRGVGLLEHSGYNIVSTKTVIANPGNLSGLDADEIELTVGGNGDLYIKDSGDFDATTPCVDKRNDLINRLGGVFKAASAGVSANLKGCSY